MDPQRGYYSIRHKTRTGPRYTIGPHSRATYNATTLLIILSLSLTSDTSIPFYLSSCPSFALPFFSLMPATHTHTLLARSDPTLIFSLTAGAGRPILFSLPFFVDDSPFVHFNIAAGDSAAYFIDDLSCSCITHIAYHHCIESILTLGFFEIDLHTNPISRSSMN